MSEIHKKISPSNISLLYLFYGTEDFIMEETKNKIINTVLSEDEKEFNLSLFNMSESPIDAAIDEAETMPFLGDKRVVIIKEALFLTGQKEKNNIDHDLVRLQQYIENPAPFTVFVIIVPFEKLDERKKIVKTLKSKSEVLHAEVQSEASIMHWMENRSKSFNVSMENEAKQKLLELIGPNLMLLSNEIDKMALFVGDGGVIEQEVVTKLSSRTLEQNIFELVENVITRNISDALRIYYDLLEQKEEPIKILALLAGQFRLILQAKLLSGKGYGQNQITSLLKVHPYRVKLAVGQGKGFSEEELKSILTNLAEADYQIKSGKMNKVLVLELFFTKIKSLSFQIK